MVRLVAEIHVLSSFPNFHVADDVERGVVFWEDVGCAWDTSVWLLLLLLLFLDLFFFLFGLGLGCSFLCGLSLGFGNLYIYLFDDEGLDIDDRWCGWRGEEHAWWGRRDCESGGVDWGLVAQEEEGGCWGEEHDEFVRLGRRGWLGATVSAPGLVWHFLRLYERLLLGCGG